MKHLRNLSFFGKRLKKAQLTSALKNKLTSTQGDSFAEVLVAILIAALGAALLASMVTAASNVTISSEKKLTELHEAESDLAASAAGKTNKLFITGGNLANTGLELEILVYTNDDFSRYELVKPNTLVFPAEGGDTP